MNAYFGYFWVKTYLDYISKDLAKMQDPYEDRRYVSECLSQLVLNSSLKDVKKY